MVIYMGTFLALAIITLQTPQFITSQCDQPEPSPGSNNFEATSVAAKNLLCKTECQCYFTNTQKYSPQCTRRQTQR